LFWEWNSSNRGIIYRMSLTFRNNHWKTYTWFQNISSTGPSISVWNMGPNALTLNRTITYGQYDDY
jgi:hypothetical protein